MKSVFIKYFVVLLGLVAFLNQDQAEASNNFVYTDKDGRNYRCEDFPRDICFRVYDPTIDWHGLVRSYKDTPPSEISFTLTDINKRQNTDVVIKVANAVKTYSYANSSLYHLFTFDKRFTYDLRSIFSNMNLDNEDIIIQVTVSPNEISNSGFVAKTFTHTIKGTKVLEPIDPQFSISYDIGNGWINAPVDSASRFSIPSSNNLSRLQIRSTSSEVESLQLGFEAEQWGSLPKVSHTRYCTNVNSGCAFNIASFNAQGRKHYNFTLTARDIHGRSYNATGGWTNASIKLGLSLANHSTHLNDLSAHLRFTSELSNFPSTQQISSHSVSLWLKGRQLALKSCAQKYICAFSSKEYASLKLVEGQYTIKAAAVANGESAAKQTYFTLTSPAPKVAITDPTAQLTLKSKADQFIIRSTASDDSAFSRHEVKLLSGNQVVATIASCGSNAVCYVNTSANALGVSHGHYTIQASALDDSGKTGYSQKVSLEVQNALPNVHIHSSEPKVGATHSIFDAVTINFSAKDTDKDGIATLGLFVEGAQIPNLAPTITSESDDEVNGYFTFVPDQVGLKANQMTKLNVLARDAAADWSLKDESNTLELNLIRPEINAPAIYRIFDGNSDISGETSRSGVFHVQVENQGAAAIRYQLLQFADTSSVSAARAQQIDALLTAGMALPPGVTQAWGASPNFSKGNLKIGQYTYCARVAVSDTQSQLRWGTLGSGQGCKTVKVDVPQAPGFSEKRHIDDNNISSGSFVLSSPATEAGVTYYLYEKQGTISETGEWTQVLSGDAFNYSTLKDTQEANTQYFPVKALGTYSYMIAACSALTGCDEAQQIKGEQLEVHVQPPELVQGQKGESPRTLMVKALNLAPNVSFYIKSMDSGANYLLAEEDVNDNNPEFLLLTAPDDELYNGLFTLGLVVEVVNPNGELANINIYGDQATTKASLTDGAPAVGPDGTVYVGANDKLYALNGVSGESKVGWPFDPEKKGQFKARPTLAQVEGETVVYAGSTNNYFYAIEDDTDPQNLGARLLWQVKTQGEIVSSAIIDEDNRVYFGSLDSALYAVDQFTGEKKWQLPLSSGIAKTPRLYGNGLIYVTTTDGQVHVVGRGNLGPDALTFASVEDSVLADHLANLPKDWYPSQDHLNLSFKVGRLFEGILGRVPTQKEHTFWSYALYNGAPASEVAKALLDSEKGLARFSNELSNTQFVDTLLALAFAEQAKTLDPKTLDPKTLDYDGYSYQQLIELFDNGFSREDVATKVLDSLEYVNLTSKRITTLTFYYYGYCWLADGCLYDYDADKDGLKDKREYELGTDVYVKDTDGDKLWDGAEVDKHNTDPLKEDTDNDNLEDGDEIARQTNPLEPDSDRDDLLDGAEVHIHGTNPLNPDSDSDGLSDGLEVKLGTNPNKSDEDEDGLTDAEELNVGTNPSSADSDGDYINDLEELLNLTDPMNPDTDGDGIKEGHEQAQGSSQTNPDTDADGVNDNLDTLPLTPEFEDVYPDTNSTLVGSLPGQFRVSESGAATYSVAFALPGGISGVTPELGLGYSSQSGNSVVGKGWSISGGSSIQRCRATQETDGYVGSVKMDNTDALCLDGTRLILITDDDNFANGAEYRTEVDSQQRIQLQNQGGEISFKVFHTDGTVWRYGTTQATQQVSKQSGVSYAWMLTSITDTYNNIIEYQYDTRDSVYAQLHDATSIPVLSEVSYGGNRVVFDYEQTLDNPWTFYVLGNKMAQSKRLSKVRIFNHVSELVYEYRLAYQTQKSGISVLSSLTWCATGELCLPATQFNYGAVDVGISDSYQEFSLNENYITGMQSTDINGDGKLELAMLAYTDSERVFDLDILDISKQGQQKRVASVEVNSLHLPHGRIYHGPNEQAAYYIADFNGDARSDVLHTDLEGNWQISFGQSDFTFLVQKLDINTDTMKPKDYFVADFNADGFSDIVYLGCEGFCILENQSGDHDTNSASFAPAAVLVTQEELLSAVVTDDATYESGELRIESTRDNHKPSAVDINGDGLPELLVRLKIKVCQNRCGEPPVKNYNIWQLFHILPDGQGGWSAQVANDSPDGFLDDPSKAKFGDINGDGLSDLVTKIDEGEYTIKLGSGLGTHTEEYEQPELRITWQESYDVEFLTDINMDGRADLVTSASYMIKEDKLTYIPESYLKWYAAVDEGFDINANSLPFDIKIAKGDSFTLMDFDQDGHPDLYTYEKETGRLRVYRDKNTLDQPTDVLTEIVVGKDQVTTNIDYKWTTDSSVYQRTEEPLLNYGKGSAVMDMTGAMAVVANVTSDMATLKGGQRARGSVEYRYESMRIQAGGRGNLGFKKLITRDPFTDITTVTQYRQDFPYIGMPEQTSVYKGDEESGLLISSATNEWKHHTLNGGKVKAPYLYQIVETKGQLNFSDNSLADTVTSLAKITTTNDYRVAQGNYLQLVEARVQTESLQNADESGIVTTSNHYLDKPENWWLNRVSETTVTHHRKGAEKDITRTSAFTYDEQTGVLTEEIVEPYGDETVYLKTAYRYDPWGNKKSVTQCSLHFAAGCNDEMQSTDDNGYKVFRRKTNRYDDEGRRLVAIGDGVQELMAYSEFDAMGRAQRADDLLTDLYTQTRYDAFGKVYYSRSATGSQSKTQYAWCEADCLPGASSYVQVEMSGKPTSVKYMNFMGQELRVATQGFAQNTLIHKDTEYDARGRVSKVYEPYFKGDEPLYYGTTQYDVFDRVTRILAPDTSITSYDYLGYKKTTRLEAQYQGVLVDWQDTLDRQRSSTKNVFGETRLIDDESGILQYVFDATGNLSEAINPDGNRVLTGFDDYGRRISIQDPSKGNWHYSYNALGEKVSSTAPDGVVTTEYRDNKGRTVSRVITQNGSTLETASFVFDNERLASESLSHGPSRSFKYDKLGRLVQTTHSLGGKTFTTAQNYDGIGRVYRAVDATGRAVRSLYNERGYLVQTQESVANNPHVYSKIKEMDARGNITQIEQGEGILTVREYDPVTGHLSGIRTNSGLIQDLSYEYNGIANLRARIDHANMDLQGNTRELVETFVYDDLNRLTQVQGAHPLILTYEANGNIKTKSDVEQGAEYQYGTRPSVCTMPAGPHAVTQIGSLSFCYDKRGNQTASFKNGVIERELSYGHFDKPTRIWTSNATTDFAYDVNRSRYKRVDTKAGEQTTTWYVGNVEIVEKPSGVTEFKRYIGNAIHTIRSNGTQERVYLHKDHQGSVDVITKANGELVENLSFDAFGQRRENAGWSPLQQNFAQLSFGHLLDGDFITQRGYTGHEHVDHAQIIHMNGRTYDPVVGRVMQADPFIQAPTNSQSYNRYSYVVNNPLSLTDPSGYFWNPGKKMFRRLIRSLAKRIGPGIVNLLGSMASALCGPAAPACSAAWSYEFTRAMGGSSSQALKGAFFSGLSASINVGGFNGFLTSGLIGGMSSVANGGEFGHGFISAGLGSLVGGMVQGINSNVGRVLARALLSGTVSKISGGKFANGAISGAFAQAMAEDWGGTSSTSSSSSKSKVDMNGDPIPVISRNHAVDTGLGLSIENGKLVGELSVACSSSVQGLCSRIVEQINSISSANEFLDINVSLANGSQADFSIGFYSEGFNAQGELTAGEWFPSTKTLSLNTYLGIDNETIRHEFGHAIGLPHMGNKTKNFMSYYGNSNPNIDVAPKLHQHQINTLTETYSRFWQKLF